MHKSRAYIFSFLNTFQLKSRKHSAKGPKANRVCPKEISGEKVGVLNITTPSLERGPSRWTPRVRTRRSAATRRNPAARHKENP